MRQWPRRLWFNPRSSHTKDSKNWLSISPCLTLSIIRYVSKIKWSKPWFGLDYVRSGEKAWRQLHKNAASNIEQVLEATLYKVPTIRHLPPITETIQDRRIRHAGHCWRSRNELISDVLLWTPLMAEQKQDDQLEHTYSSYVRIRDVALKTCQRPWTIGRNG